MQGQPSKAKLSQPTPLLAARAVTFLQCKQQHNHSRKWLSHYRQCVQLNKKWQDHMKRSLQSKSERRLGNRQQMEPVWYSCWLLDGLTDEHTAPNEYVSELTGTKKTLRKKYDLFLILPSTALIFVPVCKMPHCKHTIKSFAIVQMHGCLLQEKYRKGTYDASEPQASFFSAADTEATLPSFNPAFLSWVCETICIKDYNGKSKYLELEGITRLKEACATRAALLN